MRWRLPFEPNADNMYGGVAKLFGAGFQRLYVGQGDKCVQRNSGDQFVIVLPGTIFEVDHPFRSFNACAAAIRLVHTLWEPTSESSPDLPRPATHREAKAIIGPPTLLCLPIERIVNNT